MTLHCEHRRVKPERSDKPVMCAARTGLLCLNCSRPICPACMDAHRLAAHARPPLRCPSCFEPKGGSDPTIGLCPRCAAALAKELENWRPEEGAVAVDEEEA